GELLLHPLLPDELGQQARAEGGLEGQLVAGALGGHRTDPDLLFFAHRGHRRISHRQCPTLRRASRSSSSTGRSPFEPSPASASRASWGESPSDSRASRTSDRGPDRIWSPARPSLSFRSRMIRPATFL